MFQATFPYPGALDPTAIHRWVEKMMGGRSANHYIYATEQASPIYTAVTIRASEMPASLRDIATPMPSYTAGEVLSFTLTATAEKRAGSGPRKPLPRGDLDGRCAWLQRRSCMQGFDVLESTAREMPPLRIRKDGDTRPFALDRTRFTGVLAVSDPEAFARALLEGVGRGRAYGNGFLFVEPVETRRTA